MTCGFKVAYCILILACIIVIIIYWNYSQSILDASSVTATQPNAAARITRITGLFSLFLLCIAILALSNGIRQIVISEQSQRTQASLEFLHRYFEDEHIYRIRGLIHEYLEQITAMIAADRARFLIDRTLLVRNVSRLTSWRLPYDDLIYFVNVLDHMSTAIQLEFIPKELSRRLYVPFMRVWPHLRYFIEFVHEMRDEHSWARNYYKQAKDMASPEYRTELRKAGIEPFPAQSRIVWVVGPQASGKRYFIEHLIKHKPQNILYPLGLDHRHLGICSESLPTAVYNRDELNKLIPSYLTSPQNQVEFIKLQLTAPSYLPDFNIIRKMKQRLPFYDHSIIYLDCQAETMLLRLRERNKIHYDFDALLIEHNKLLDMVKEIRADLSVACVRSTTPPYKIVKKW